MATIVVQPPSTATVDTYLEPPVVVGFSGSPPPGAFASAELVDGYNEAPIEGLAGFLTVNGVAITDPAGPTTNGASTSAPLMTFFTFTDLSIPFAGTFRIRITILVVNQDTGDLDLISEATTRSFTVYDDAVASQRPSSKERKILRALRLQGVHGIRAY